MKKIILLYLLILTAAPSLGMSGESAEVLDSYRRLLPLQGGSNFRDVGGYKTEDGYTVLRGLIFRSGAMTSLTSADIDYLDQFDFQTIVDFRSSEERALYPNFWAVNTDIDMIARDYSIIPSLQSLGASKDRVKAISETYPNMLVNIEPQLRTLVRRLLDGKTPLVFNCSAGQDRTGTTAALLLTVLGVPKDTIIEDYLLSTDFRQTANEQGGVDLVKASETNEFAKMMLRFSEGHEGPSRPNSLLTPEGRPFLDFTLEWIDEEYGSVEAYFERQLGFSAADIEKLRAMYRH